MLEGEMGAMPASLLSLLQVAPPAHIPGANPRIMEMFSEVQLKRIIIVMIDNFGLFEITYFKPEFVIGATNALLLLATQNPYTLGVYHQLMFGGFEYEPQGFHFLKYLNATSHSTMLIGRKKDVSRYAGGTPSSVAETDNMAWTQAIQHINRTNLTWVHFLDFESVHRRRQYQESSMEELMQKLITRTDRWIKTMHSQLRPGSLMIVLGDHGRYRLDFNYQGKIAEMRAASVPLALLMYK
jgi:hypothetical protein